MDTAPKYVESTLGESSRDARNSFLKTPSLFSTLFAAFAVSVVLWFFFFGAFVVEGSSMTPTLHGGDQVLVLQNRLLSFHVKEDDIVVIDGQRLAVSDPSDGLPLIKRIHRHFDSGYFVTGDNPMKSIDSRRFGPVPSESLVGKAVLVYFPLHRIRLL